MQKPVLLQGDLAPNPLTRALSLVRGLRRQDDDWAHLVLYVPLVHLSIVDSRKFPVSAAAVWNDLPVHVTSAPSLAIFRQHLKTLLFLRSYPDIVI